MIKKRKFLFERVYVSVFFLSGIPRAFAAVSPVLSPCQIKPTMSIVPCIRVAPILRQLRGGDGDGRLVRNNNSQSVTSILKSTHVRYRQGSFLFQRVWKLVVERVTPTINNSSWGHDNGNIAEGKKNNLPENEASSYIRKDSSSNAAIGDCNTVRTQYSPFRMYGSCMSIVSLWILIGTIFYSVTNEWPIPQSFFYSIDAGMSIGFCTDVMETKLVSKAFTVVYILLGASVVGGALALFIQDIVEGVVERERRKNSSIMTKQYELMLEKEIFERFDVSQKGALTKKDFKKLLDSTISHVKSSTPQLSEDSIDVLWTKFDRIKDGVIHFEEFAGTYRGIEGLIDSLHSQKNDISSTNIQNQNKSVSKKLKWIFSLASSISSFVSPALESRNRIYIVFLVWVFIGIAWGMLDQGWDPITSTHFAISALATGGLTAPPVNSSGILPARPAVFCGFYCLFGIPLMAVTFSHFARALVSDHVAEMEKWALTRPMTASDYEIAKQYLLSATGAKVHSYGTKSIKKKRRQSASSSESAATWRGMRLSDFVVLQLLRQGRISVETINILKKEFELLDVDKSGLLTLEEATNP